MIHETQRHTTRPTISLSEVGKRLGAAIVATAEYQAFRTAERHYRDDDQAKELLGKYQDAQRTIQLMRQLKTDGADEEQELEHLQKEFEANQTLTKYFYTQEKLIALLTELNEFISERLNIDFAGLTKPKSGCCG